MARYTIFTVFLIIFVISGCGIAHDVSLQRSSYAQKSGVNLKIGVAWPFALHNDLFWEGIVLACEEINNSGGILGKKIELLKNDDNSEVTNGLKIAERLSENPEVMAVIGHYNSYITLPVALYYETAKLLMITPGSTNPELTKKGYRYIKRDIPNDEMIGKKAADYCAANGYQKIVICYGENSYGLGLANSFEKQARGNGIKIIDRLSFNLGNDTEFEYIINRWKIYDFQAIFFADTIVPGIQFIQKARNNGFYYPIIGGDGLDSAELLKLDKYDSQSIYFITVFNPYSNQDRTIQFNQSFWKKYNKLPDSWSAQGYDTLYLLAEAMKNAGSVDPQTVAPIFGRIQNYRGVTGNYSFDTNGDVKGKPLVLKFVYDSEFKYLDLD